MNSSPRIPDSQSFPPKLVADRSRSSGSLTVQPFLYQGQLTTVVEMSVLIDINDNIHGDDFQRTRRVSLRLADSGVSVRSRHLAAVAHSHFETPNMLRIASLGETRLRVTPVRVNDSRCRPFPTQFHGVADRTFDLLPAFALRFKVEDGLRVPGRGLKLLQVLLQSIGPIPILSIDTGARSRRQK